jgi:hypothetical protein
MIGRRRGSLRSRVARLEERVAAQPAAPPVERPIVLVRYRAGEPVSEAPPGAFVIRIVRPAGAPDLDPETGSLPRRLHRADATGFYGGQSVTSGRNPMRSSRPPRQRPMSTE